MGCDQSRFIIGGPSNALCDDNGEDTALRETRNPSAVKVAENRSQRLAS